MDIETRKRLTEKLLGGKWHAFRGQSMTTGKWFCTCASGMDTGYFDKVKLEEHCRNNNRTFTAPADALDTMNRLVETGKWEKFLSYAICEFQDGRQLDPGEWRNHIPALIGWLFSCDYTDLSGLYRICTLAGEFIEQTKGDGK